MIDKTLIEAITAIAPTPVIHPLGSGDDARPVLLVPNGEGAFSTVIESDLQLRDAKNDEAHEKALDRGYPPPVKVATLTGLVDWLRNNLEHVDLTTVTVHVTSPTSVAVFGTADAFQRRQAIVDADCSSFTPVLEFTGKQMELERFHIMLQSNFAPTAQRDAVLRIAGNATESAARTIADSGIAQVVTVKTGIELANTVVPNPVALAPFRTFREVPQPESAFVFRLHGGEDGKTKPAASLHEADGAYWKHTAMRAVVDFLVARLTDEEDPGVPAVLAANQVIA